MASQATMNTFNISVEIALAFINLSCTAMSYLPLMLVGKASGLTLFSVINH
jgi:hypothetical protein